MPARAGHGALETRLVPTRQQASDLQWERCLWTLELAVQLNRDLPKGGHRGPWRHWEDT